jgi:hypothetical protein
MRALPIAFGSAVVLGVLVAGCENNSGSSSGGGGGGGGGLSISPSGVNLTSNDQRVAFTARNGAAPYRWEIANTNLGTLLGTPVGTPTRDRQVTYVRSAATASGINILRVSDNAGSRASANIVQGAYNPSGTGPIRSVSGERIATASPGRSYYAGTLRRRPVVPSSVVIRGGAFSLTDDGQGRLTGGGKTGSVSYASGVWSLDLLGEWPPEGTVFTADYQYTTAATVGRAAGVGALPALAILMPAAR